MLVRVSGRHDGVKEYLETGRKVGRELERDEMDERVVLAGDLELTHSVIQSIEAGEGVDRYLSITMSFKEDEVSRETLEAITAEFKQFVGVAYLPEEFNFYAEAHLPKVKSYIDDATAKLVERKAHIHVVIPKLNLISGGHLEALGYYKSNIQFVEAFQEHINAKFGLASPKDNRRVGFTDASEMISRYKGDLFKAAGRDLKETLLDAVLDRKIERYDDFMALLVEHGHARLRNEGRENEYANVKPFDAEKGVNLKEQVFSRAFVELPTHEKLLQLSADVAPSYEATGKARETDPRYLKALEQWQQTRALEVKYLNNGNTTGFPAYQAASLDQRIALLAERQEAFYSKHRQDHHEPGSERPSRSPFSSTSGRSRRHDAPGIDELGAGDRRLRGDGRLYECDRGAGIDARITRRGPSGGSPGGLPRGAERGSPRGPRGATPERRQHGALPDSQGAPPPAFDGMRGLSGVPVDRFAARRAVLVSPDALHQLEHERAVSPDSVRRNRHIDRAGIKPTGRRADSVLSQLMRDEREHLVLRSAGREYTVIRQELDPRRLLAELSHTHGVRPEKYGITTGRDGTHRIRAGARHLNVADFLTKELHLPWRDASEILRGTHQRQVDGAAMPLAKELPRAALWREFTHERDAFRRVRQDAMTTQYTSEKGRRDQIRQTFVGARDAAREQVNLRPSRRRALVSIARMTRADAEQSLRAQIQIERNGLKAKYGERHGASFGEFLQARAQAGDVRALLELRRLRPTTPEEPKPEENWILPAGAGRDSGTSMPASASGWSATDDNQIIYRAPQLTYEVHRDGDVTYRHDGRSVVRDQGSAVRVLEKDPAAIEAALRLAQAKFGSVLKLKGPIETQRAAARVAAEAGLYVEFSDNALNDIMQARRAALIAERATSVESRAQGRSRPVDLPSHHAPAALRPAPTPEPDADVPPHNPSAPKL